jgi:hypothetical protein
MVTKGIEGQQYYLIAQALNHYCKSNDTRDDCNWISGPITSWKSEAPGGGVTLAFRNGDDTQMFLGCKRDGNKYKCDLGVREEYVFGGGDGVFFNCSGTPTADPFKWGDTHYDAAEADVPPDIPEDVPSEAVDTSTPEVFEDKPGFNSRYVRPRCGEIVDLEQSGDYIVGMCSKPAGASKYMDYFQAKRGDWHNTPEVENYPGLGSEIAIPLNGNYVTYQTYPEQLIVSTVGQYAGIFIVPFRDANEAMCRSGISFIAPDGPYASPVAPFTFVGLDAENSETWTPCGVKSAAIVEGQAGPEIWMPAKVQSSQGQIGILKSCNLAAGNGFKLTKTGCDTLPVILGQTATANSEPTAISVLPNPIEGVDTGPVGAVLDKSAIHIVRLDNSPTAADPVIATITPNVGNFAALKDLPMTEDGKYAVIPSDGHLLKICLETFTTAGYFQSNLINAAKVSDVVVKGDKAYMAMDKSIYIFDIGGDNPNPVNVINVGTDLGSITVDGDGIIYVANLDDWDADGNWRITAINPNEAQSSTVYW